MIKLNKHDKINRNIIEEAIQHAITINKFKHD